MVFCLMMWSKNLLLLAYIAPQPGHATTLSWLWLRRCSRSLCRPLKEASQSVERWAEVLAMPRCQDILAGRYNLQIVTFATWSYNLDVYLSTCIAPGNHCLLAVCQCRCRASPHGGRTTLGFQRTVALRSMDTTTKHFKFKQTKCQHLCITCSCQNQLD